MNSKFHPELSLDRSVVLEHGYTSQSPVARVGCSDNAYCTRTKTAGIDELLPAIQKGSDATGDGDNIVLVSGCAVAEI